MPLNASAQSVFIISGPDMPWLWPALELSGLAMQLAAAVFRKRLLLPAGFIPICAGCYIERDISLFVGDALAWIGLWFYLKKMTP